MRRPGNRRSVGWLTWAALGGLAIVGAGAFWAIDWRDIAVGSSQASVEMTSSRTDEGAGNDLYTSIGGMIGHRARGGRIEPAGNVVPGLSLPLNEPFVAGLKFVDRDCVRIVQPDVIGHFCVQRWINSNEAMATDLRLAWISGVAKSRNGAILTTIDTVSKLARAEGVRAEGTGDRGGPTQFTWWSPTGSIHDLGDGCRQVKQGFTASPVVLRSTHRLCGGSFGPGPQLVGPNVMSFRWEGSKRSEVEFEAGMEWQFPPRQGYELRTLVTLRTD